MAEGNVSLDKEELFYYCARCKKVLNSQKISFISVSCEESEFKCVMCGTTFTGGFKAKKMESIDICPYFCFYCDRMFPSSTELLIHSFEHSGEGRFRCFLCQLNFATNSSLESHFTTEIVQCIKCSDVFWGNFCPNYPPGRLQEMEDLVCVKCSFV
ncbi:hypothetical protein TNIN_436031 [Trichonephila inaurata madagascariensis]|uniref:C2H2-type domain-containing protein n=1 Tax=Trichonephila inaurata madagascariensis TaxID=2747483 RepID=A0A8X6XCB5_9ARAC|nr:hypothetical protein TNIN_436031 [Trichonephila inaurata madagascariensis]